MSSTDRFIDFCTKALTGPLEKAPGATIDALQKAFMALEALDAPPPMEPEKLPEPVVKQASVIQEFHDQVYSEPWTVYVIRNTINGVCYVGRAAKGFKDRYPRGRWWAKHHCDRLVDDVLNFGLTSFKVCVYVGNDEQDMKRLEAQLISAHRFFTYNERPEPDCGVDQFPKL